MHVLGQRWAYDAYDTKDKPFCFGPLKLVVIKVNELHKLLSVFLLQSISWEVLRNYPRELNAVLSNEIHSMVVAPDDWVINIEVPFVCQLCLFSSWVVSWIPIVINLKFRLLLVFRNYLVSVHQSEEYGQSKHQKHEQQGEEIHLSSDSLDAKTDWVQTIFICADILKI
jgi:hypothetical protein